MRLTIKGVDSRDKVKHKGLYSMPSLILSKWRERWIEVIWLDLGTLKTVRASTSKIVLDLLGTAQLGLRKVIVKSITVIKSGVHDRCSNGTGSWRVELWSAYHSSDTTRTHHASATPIALASTASTSAIQTSLYHEQVTTWSGRST